MSNDDSTQKDLVLGSLLLSTDDEVSAQNSDGQNARTAKLIDAGSSVEAPASSDDGAAEPRAEEESEKGHVWLHVYDLDPYTGWANSAFLRNLEIGVYHCGVEVYGREWSFLFFADALDADKVRLLGEPSGVIHCMPKQLAGYKYRESIYMGATPLSQVEVKSLIWMLTDEWLASTYHITHRNCVSFAETLVGKLKVGNEFPPWIKKLSDVSNRSRVANYVIDGAWGWHKWYMSKPWDKNEVSSSSDTVSWWDMLRCAPSVQKSDNEVIHNDQGVDDDDEVAHPIPPLSRQSYWITKDSESERASLPKDQDADPERAPLLAESNSAAFPPPGQGKKPPFLGDAGIHEPY